MKERLTYKTPSFRQLGLETDENFMTSGFGENADPQPGTWSTSADPFED